MSSRSARKQFPTSRFTRYQLRVENKGMGAVKSCQACEAEYLLWCLRKDGTWRVYRLYTPMATAGELVHNFGVTIALENDNDNEYRAENRPWPVATSRWSGILCAHFGLHGSEVVHPKSYVQNCGYRLLNDSLYCPRCSRSAETVCVSYAYPLHLRPPRITPPVPESGHC